MNRRRSAYSHQYLFFQHPQQLGLTAQAEVADLVQEQRALIGQLEFSLPCLLGVGKSAFLVAEQLAFGQRVGYRGTVYAMNGLSLRELR